MSVAGALLAFTFLTHATAPQDVPGFKGPAVLEGRFLSPDGTPAAGVQLEVHGWGATHERVLEFGEPKNWTDPTGVSDAEGSLPDPLRAAAGLSIRARREGRGLRRGLLALGRDRDR